MDTKRCSRCKQHKPYGEFHKLKRAKDGHQYRCKVCVAEVQRERQGAGKRKPAPKRQAVAKRCPQCKTVKPPEDYFKNRSNPDGLQSYCKPCWMATTKKWEEDHRGPMRDYHRTYQREWRLAGFGLTLEDYDRMYDEQKGVCALCFQPEECTHRSSGRVYTLAVDHCHKSGKVRGLLCRTCNQTLGRCNDDPALLRRMADYLER